MPTYIIESIEFERAGENQPRVLESVRHRLDHSQIQTVVRTLLQVSRFPLWSAPVPHAIRILDEHGQELIRWDDWAESKAVVEDNRRKAEEAKKLWSDDA